MPRVFIGKFSEGETPVCHKNGAKIRKFFECCLTL